MKSCYLEVEKSFTVLNIYQSTKLFYQQKMLKSIDFTENRTQEIGIQNLRLFATRP